MFDNHMRMVRHLSYHKERLQFIAKYYFNAGLVDKDAVSYKGFKLIIEEGMGDYALIESSI